MAGNSWRCLIMSINGWKFAGNGGIWVKIVTENGWKWLEIDESS